MKKIKYIILSLLFMIPMMVDAAGSIKVSPTNLSMDKDTQKNIEITAINSAGLIEVTTSNKSVVLLNATTSDTVVAIEKGYRIFVDNSTVKLNVIGNDVGSATINVYLKDAATYDGEELNGTKTVNVKVNEKKIEASEVILSKTSATIDIGKDITLTATIKPSNAENKTITWISSNTKVATVSNGKVVGISKGTATITAKTSNGKTATCKITVTGNDNNTNDSSNSKPKIDVTSIDLDLKNIEVNIGEKKTITAIIKPLNATNKNVTWTSSDNTIASVVNGNITGIKEGTVTITAKTSNGKTAICNVVVKTKEVSIVTKEIDIKRLEIVGYNIDFSKDKKEYNIDVLNSVNKLYIIVEANDVNVVGDKDIDITNKDFVIVRVSNDTNAIEYKININRVESAKSKPTEDNNILLYMLYFFLGTSVILSVIVIKLSLKKNKIE